jgi:polygalacturonase
LTFLKSEEKTMKSLKFCFFCTLLFFCPFSLLAQNTAPAVDWNTKAQIEQRIVPPVFPQKDFNVERYGASGNGKKECTKAFAKAIEACSKAGGGRVVVPAGEYLTGPIVLKNNVNLYIAEGAVVRFLTDPEKYLPVVYCRWEGVECMNYSPLIYAFEQTNIAVTGQGILDGQGSSEHWWPWKGLKNFGWKEGMPLQKAGRDRLNEWGQENFPVAQRLCGDGAYLRPNFFEPYRCSNVLVEGVTFKNSPMWFLNPTLCNNVSILNVKTIGLGPNNDGCDPESCTDVLIRGCFFNNGDDCIAIKSGRNTDGRRVHVPCANLIVDQCTMRNGHGGVSIGSEISGGVRNVFIENDTMDSPNLDRALRIKTNAMRGGTIENIFMRHVKVGQVSEAAIKIDFFYEEAEKGDFLPIVRNVEVKNVECGKSRFGICIQGFKNDPAENIHIEDCTFLNVAEPNVIENVRNFNLINVKTELSQHK